MKTKLVLSIIVAMFLIFAVQAYAFDLKGQKGATAKFGVSVLTQDIDTDTEGDPGFIVGGRFFYGLNEYAAVGLGVEWETHGVEVAGAGDIGDGSAISIIPFVQLRKPGSGPLSPYGLLGLGFNINSFDESSELDNFCITNYGAVCEVELDNTFALQIGGGVDYFIKDNIAINGELVWKLNSGDGAVTVLGVPIDIGDSNASVIEFTGGATILF